MPYIRRKTGLNNVDQVIDDIYRILNRLISAQNTGAVDTNLITTLEGGLAIRVTNGESFILPKGFLVRASSVDNRTVLLAVEGDYDIVGVVYNPIAPGDAGYVVVVGNADVWFNANGSTRRHYFRMSKTADTVNADAGKAQSDSINRIDTIRLKGYVFDTRTGEGLSRCVLIR